MSIGKPGFASQQATHHTHSSLPLFPPPTVPPSLLLCYGLRLSVFLPTFVYLSRIISFGILNLCFFAEFLIWVFCISTCFSGTTRIIKSFGKNRGLELQKELASLIRCVKFCFLDRVLDGFEQLGFGFWRH
ncbi:hypothetical protein ACFX12_026846 [Malus domestica]